MPSLGKKEEKEAAHADLVVEDSESPVEPLVPQFHCPSKENLRQRGATLGYRVSIHPSAIIENPEKLTLGDDVQIGPGVCIDASGSVRIGDRTILGPGVRILSSVPFIPSGNRRIFEHKARQVKVEIHEDTFIGSGAIVLPGTEICVGCVVEPNIVVTRYCQPYSIVRTPSSVRHLSRNEQIDPGW